jgi:hypothetical protein
MISRTCRNGTDTPGARYGLVSGTVGRRACAGQANAARAARAEQRADVPAGGTATTKEEVGRTGLQLIGRVHQDAALAHVETAQDGTVGEPGTHPRRTGQAEPCHPGPSVCGRGSAYWLGIDAGEEEVNSHG